MTNNFVFEPDMVAKKIHIVREFNAPIEKVWKAWTDPDLLEKWWSPKPFKAVTEIMDFTLGGTWKFAMVGPDGKKSWIYAEFTAIEHGKTISSAAGFCDDEGNPVVNGPKWYRTTTFAAIDGDRTRVDIVIPFDDEATLKSFAEGYFKEGTAMSYNQLDELLAAE